MGVFIRGKVKLVILHTYPPIKIEQTECSETSAYKIQTPGNYPEECIDKTYVKHLYRQNLCKISL